VCLTVHH